MSDYIKGKLRVLKARKKQLQYFEEKIKYKREQFEKKIEKERAEFEKSLSSLKNDSLYAFQDYDMLAKDTVTIALGDLVEELSYLTGVDLKDIKITIKTNVGYIGNINLTKMRRLIEGDFQHLSCTINNGQNNIWKLLLFGEKELIPQRKTPIFCYSLEFPLDLNEIQADGKTLLEHASVDVKYNESYREARSLLTINKKIEYLNCNIELDNLIRSNYKDNNFNSWYPANIFTQAVINCIEKKKYSNKKKKKLSLV